MQAPAAAHRAWRAAPLLLPGTWRPRPAPAPSSQTPACRWRGCRCRQLTRSCRLQATLGGPSASIDRSRTGHMMAPESWCSCAPSEQYGQRNRQGTGISALGMHGMAWHGKDSSTCCMLHTGGTCHMPGGGRREALLLLHCQRFHHVPWWTKKLQTVRPSSTPELKLKTG